MFRTISGLVVVTAMVLALGAVTAGAADEPQNVIKYRKMIMSAMAGHAGAIASVVKGEVTYSSHVASHARSLHETSLMLDDIFPPGSGVGDTRAKPEIWKDTDKFAAARKALQNTSAELARIAADGDMAAIGAALGKVGESCGGCHKPFRKEKQ